MPAPISRAVRPKLWPVVEAYEVAKTVPAASISAIC